MLTGKRKAALLGVGLSLAIAVASQGRALAQVPQLIRYQGTLTDAAGSPLNGTYTLTFRFYDAATGGNKMWEETQNGVAVTQGAFSILLGSVTALTLKFDKDCWLAVSVNGAAELTPRHRVASVPNAYLSDKAEALVDRGARVMHSVDQSIADNVATKLAFNQERWDTDTIHDETTENTRLTCKTAGKYLIFANISWDYRPGGDRRIAIILNRAADLARVSSGPNPVNKTWQQIITYANLAAGDFVELEVQQTSGGAVTVLREPPFSPEFGMVKIS